MIVRICNGLYDSCLLVPRSGVSSCDCVMLDLQVSVTSQQPERRLSAWGRQKRLWLAPICAVWLAMTASWPGCDNSVSLGLQAGLHRQSRAGPAGRGETSEERRRPGFFLKLTSKGGYSAELQILTNEIVATAPPRVLLF